MTAQPKSILCGSCFVPVRSSQDTDGNITCICPKCGETAPLEVALESVQAHALDQLARGLLEGLLSPLSGSKAVTATKRHQPIICYRFITDLVI